jgi:hypothetical protein
MHSLDFSSGLNSVKPKLGGSNLGLVIFVHLPCVGIPVWVELKLYKISASIDTTSTATLFSAAASQTLLVLSTHYQFNRRAFTTIPPPLVWPQ